MRWLLWLGMSGLCGCAEPSTIWIGSDEPDASAPLPSGAPPDVYLAWLFERGEARAVEVDASGHGHDAKLSGQPSPSDPAPNGRGGNARGAFFDGDDDGAALAAPEAALGELTVALWLKPADIEHGTLLTAADAAGSRLLELRLASGRLQLEASDGTTLARESPLVVDRWVHVAFTRDSAAGTALFVDAKPAARDFTTRTPLARWVLGGVDSTPFRGELDEVLIYARALSDAEVEATRGSP